jgi:hypothetical protein
MAEKRRRDPQNMPQQLRLCLEEWDGILSHADARRVMGVPVNQSCYAEKTF